MPSAETIIWAAIGGLILIMLAIIGYLIDKGFAGLKSQMEALWKKLDSHQTLAESNERKIAAIEARCEERHRGRRATDP